VAFCFPLDKLAQDSYDVVTYHFALFLLPQWCFILPLCGGAKRHKKMWVRLKRFLAGGIFFYKPKLWWQVRVQCFFPNMFFQVINAFFTF
jgi:hypothetical protein